MSKTEEWRDHVEQRIRNWRQRTMNKSGDMLAIDDFMGQESIDDLVDYVCDEWAFPIQRNKPEPVAYGVLDDDGQIDWTADYPFSNEPGWPDSVPLYTAPPQREWQGLTEGEHANIAVEAGCASADWVFYGAAVERALKEKNK